MKSPRFRDTPGYPTICAHGRSIPSLVRNRTCPHVSCHAAHTPRHPVALPSAHPFSQTLPSAIHCDSNDARSSPGAATPRQPRSSHARGYDPPPFSGAVAHPVEGKTLREKSEMRNGEGWREVEGKQDGGSRLVRFASSLFRISGALVSQGATPKPQMPFPRRSVSGVIGPIPPKPQTHGVPPLVFIVFRGSGCLRIQTLNPPSLTQTGRGGAPAPPGKLRRCRHPQ